MVESNASSAAPKNGATPEQLAKYSLLPDPVPDRTLTDAQCPTQINKPLVDTDLFGENDLPDWKLLKDFLAREGPI